MDPSDRLDAALDEFARRPLDEDIVPLVELAVEVASSLQRGWLTPEERNRLYSRAIELAVRRSPWGVARRLVSEHRVPAIAGGAAVTLAAGAAITLAITRQHRGAAPIAA
jgi:hypothetical protein